MRSGFPANELYAPPKASEIFTGHGCTIAGKANQSNKLESYAQINHPDPNGVIQGQFGPEYNKFVETWVVSVIDTFNAELSTTRSRLLRKGCVRVFCDFSKSTLP